MVLRRTHSLIEACENFSTSFTAKIEKKNQDSGYTTDL